MKYFWTMNNKKAPTLFDFIDKQRQLSAHKDPLAKLHAVIDWEAFRPVITRAFPVVDYSTGGRPPYDKVMMFKILVLQHFYDLSDAETEFQLQDRLTFMRFVGLGLNDSVPDQNTIRNFREALTRFGQVDSLFEAFGKRLSEAGFLVRKGSIVDASLVSAPIQRNSKEENRRIKEGATPEDWSEKKRSHKDTEARWTRKNNRNYFGYKTHIKIDSGSKLITSYDTTAANINDNNVLVNLLDDSDAGTTLHGDSAYRSREIEALLKKQGIRSRIQERGGYNHPLTEAQQASNRKKSKVRVRVEHVFGWMHRNVQEICVRTIGRQRAAGKMAILNLVYNMARVVQLIVAGRRRVQPV